MHVGVEVADPFIAPAKPPRDSEVTNDGVPPAVFFCCSRSLAIAALVRLDRLADLLKAVGVERVDHLLEIVGDRSRITTAWPCVVPEVPVEQVREDDAEAGHEADRAWGRPSSSARIHAGKLRPLFAGGEAFAHDQLIPVGEGQRPGLRADESRHSVILSRAEGRRQAVALDPELLQSETTSGAA